MWRIPLFDLNYDDAERQAVLNVLDSKWLTMGERTLQFEDSFGKMLGSEGINCTFTANCTASLYMAVLAAGLQSGDEVIIPALTFVADLNAVVMAGATPVLADCTSFDDWNISAATIEAVITPKSKAVIIVHFAGYPCDMEPIISLCQRRGLFLIEDVAHAPGATYRGKACGTFGDIGCFSFFSNKNLSVGEGGMLSTSSLELHDKIRHIRSHGMSSLTLDRHKGRTISYDVIEPGLNFRADEIRAALGLVQLVKLSASNRRRGELTRYYRDSLSSIEWVSIPFIDRQESVPSYHILPLLLADDIDRNKFILQMKEAGIQTSVHYPSFHGFSAFKDLDLNPTPISDQISEHEITLPLYPDLKESDIDYIASVIKKHLP